MYQLIKPDLLFFATGIIGLGILSLMAGDFIAGRPSVWPADIPGKLIWAYISRTILIIAGVAIVFNKRGRSNCPCYWSNDFSLFFFVKTSTGNV